MTRRPARGRLRLGVGACAVAGVLALAAAARAANAGVAGALAGEPAVKASLTPRTHLFGDSVLARVDVIVERKQLDPERIEAQLDFAPYERVTIRRDRQDSGGLTLLTYTARLRCLTSQCLPRRTRRTFTFRPATISFQAAGGGGSVSARFPPLVVVSRLGRRDLAQDDALARPPWRARIFPLEKASYRISPRGAAAVSFGAASALVVAAALLGLRYGRRRAPEERRRRVPFRMLSPLERALALVEDAGAEERSSDRRKALELLAGELRSGGDAGLAQAARELAWSERGPQAEDTRTLVRNVRNVMEAGSNGASG